ncbi:MAG: hypothetical protein HN802_02550 [Candidatus Jacksonbacteria bacterium]|jgi:hypothetical protein|nr:hypothetical protein [Candidatus Jacksonbacteria bacterium]
MINQSTCDLSIIVPGIQPENWESLYERTKLAVKNHTFEIIFCGPRGLPSYFDDIINVKFIRDYGTPSRCFQLAGYIAEGTYLTWLTDDGEIEEDSIDLALDLIKEKESIDIVTMRYTESDTEEGRQTEFPLEYYNVSYHPDTNHPGVESHWKIPCVMLLNTNYYRQLGGLDCRYEHMNMNVHDLGFRAQRNGSVVYYSPTVIMRCVWDPHRNAQNSPIIAAFVYNDKPLFQYDYAAPQVAKLKPICIDYDNWRNNHSVWPRRFGTIDKGQYLLNKDKVKK